VAQDLERFATGLVLGKFYPLTKGHQFLIETARRRCSKLYVAVGSRLDESISPEIRAAWIRQLYPDVIVVVQPSTLPYFPHECTTPDEFYLLWTQALREVCDGQSPEALFTSEDYGEVMAQYLGCSHVLVDKARNAVPISATQVRANPLACWEYLDPVVRAYFVRTVCIYGPESTGKTTLCEQLARHFGTIWQPEWARDYLGERHCEYPDMEIIARGHFADHDRFRRQAHRILFMDTEAITTLIYSQQYYGRSPAYVTEMADRMHQFVHLYLFTDIDVPWIPDTSRDLGAPAQRALMRQRMLDQLDQRGLPYVMISGDWETRFASAIRAVEMHVLK